MIKYIIKTLQSILIINYWIVIGAGGILGYELMPEVKIIGALVGIFVGFISATVFSGPILILIQINDTLSVMADKDIDGAYKSQISKVNDAQILTNNILKDIYYILSNNSNDTKQTINTTKLQSAPLKEIKL